MRYQVFMMLVANSLPPGAPAAAAKASAERRVRAMQLEPKRTFVDQSLLPLVADISVLRASLLPPSNRIAVHMQLYSANDPSDAYDSVLCVRPNVLWPVAKLRTAGGAIAQVNIIADKRGRVRREYRVENAGEQQLIVAHHGVKIERVDATKRGVEIHGRAWHLGGERRSFAALVHRNDIGYTFDLGKLGGHWLRLDVRGDRLLGLSAVSDG